MNKIVGNISSIAKTAQTQARYRRAVFGFSSAREAFRAWLSAYGVTAGDVVLLPSFIGWSEREGSGVYDPVASAGARPLFYRMNRNLLIDVEDVLRKIAGLKPRVLVLVHYYGYPDPNASMLAGYARERGILVLEDEAHSMFSDLVGGVCGRSGDAAIFSLHKMLPFRDGGTLILNHPGHGLVETCLKESQQEGRLRAFWEYDLHHIAAIRRQNAEQLTAALAPLAGRLDLLFPTLPEGVVPQTLPVVIQRASRNDLYFRMNDAAFGVVSLYHTLIDSIDPEEFPESYALASRIMNLPVHQDAEPEQLTAMIDKLRELA